MRRVYAAGETLLDIIFRDDQPVAAKPGGSVLNCSVTLGRTGVPVSFLSESGDDRTGKIIERFLIENHVSVDYLIKYKGVTPLALAFLDEKNEASYSFYRPRENSPHDDFPVCFTAEDIFLTGGFYAVRSELRSQVTSLLRKAKEHETIIFYDPNYRKPHLDQLEESFSNILENIAFADIIRGSDEDFFNVFGISDVETVYQELSLHGNVILIYTRGEGNVTIRTRELTAHFPVEPVKPLSTIGAGDSFNAGLIHGLITQGITRKDLIKVDAGTWESMIQTAISFAAGVCRSLDNYISEEQGRSYYIPYICHL